jgi:hypothetical protein
MKRFGLGNLVQSIFPRKYWNSFPISFKGIWPVYGELIDFSSNLGFKYIDSNILVTVSIIRLTTGLEPFKRILILFNSFGIPKESDLVQVIGSNGVLLAIHLAM